MVSAESVQEQESLTDIAEQRIFSYMKDNNLKPGDSFPREQDLAEMLQMSRPIVREALSRLRMLGFITSRKRRGMVVSSPSVFETLKKTMDPAFLGEKERLDFFGLRIIIEIGLSDILAFSVTDEDIEEMESIVKAEEAEPGNMDIYSDCDYRFHMCIYKATRCAALESFQTVLYRHFSDSKKNLKSSVFANRFTDNDQSSHRCVLEAIKTRLPEVIHKAMRKHMFSPMETYKRMHILSNGK